MSLCTVKKLSNKAWDSLTSLGLSKEELLKNDSNAVKASELSDTLDVPIAGALMEQATSFLQQSGTALAGGATNAILSSPAIASLTSAASSVLSVACLGMAYDTLFTQALFAMQAEALKKQLNIRIMYYRLLVYHTTNILNVMYYFAQPTSKPNRQKLMAAYRYVTEAGDYWLRVYNDMNASIPGATSRFTIKRIFQKTNAASKILQGDQAFANQLYQAVKTNTNKKVSKINARDFGAAAQLVVNKFNQEVLEKSLYAIESIAWNLTRMASITLLPPVALGALGLNPTALTNSGTSTRTFGKTKLSGVQTVRFNSTAADTTVENMKKAAGLGDKILAYDAAKGIVATNIMINSLMDSLADFDIQVGKLQDAASMFLTMLSPAGTIINKVQQEMFSSLENSDSELILAGKETLWVLELDSLKIFENSLLAPGERTAALGESVQASKDVQAAIEKYQEKNINHTTIFKLILNVGVQAVLAPVSKKALKETIILCTMSIRQLRAALQADQALVSVLNGVAFNSNPLFSELMNLLSNAPAPGPAIFTALSTGQVAAVTAGLTTITAGLRAGADAISDAAAECEKETINENQRLAAETKAANDVAAARAAADLKRKQEQLEEQGAAGAGVAPYEEAF